MESSFYQNVYLLTQAVQPHKDFHKYFKEGMFSKPNTIGFLHVSQYLLSIYDGERCKKMLKWPLHCKKDESEYRTNVKDFLISVAQENPDMDFPQILVSHLLHASGSKFSLVMWNLSTVALRTYIKRETGISLLAPKSGVAEDLSRVLFNNVITESTKNIDDISTRMIIGEQEAKAYANEIAELIQKHQEDLFLTRRNLMDIAPQAPVHPAMQKRLADPNDVEVIQIWKESVKESLAYLKGKQKRLKEIAELSSSVAGMVTSIASSDSNTFDGNSLLNIDTNALSEIDGLAPETQIIIHHLYENGVISLENLLALVCQLLSNFWRCMEKQGFPDLAECEPQVRASCEDMNSMIRLFLSLSERIAEISSKIKSNPTCENFKDTQQNFYLQHVDHDIFDSVLLKSSPTININGGNEPERTDVNERLELTPVENIHKSLFSRHKRKDDTTPQFSKLRPKLLVSRINFDDTRPSCSNEKMLSPVNRSASSRFMNQSTASRSGKYSRLFSTYQKKNSNRLNSSMMSVPGSWRNSTVADMNATCDLYNMSELRPHVTSVESRFDQNRDVSTPLKYTPTKRNGNRTPSTAIEEERSVPQVTVSQTTVIDEKTELSIEVGRSPKIWQAERAVDRNRRTSISDLVERYRRVREKANDVTAHLESSSDVSDESVKH